MTLGSIPDIWGETRSLVEQIPEGMVSTFGSVAEALGDAVAARFVGSALGVLPVSAPWRVVRSDGLLGSKSTPVAEVREKSRRLAAEGVPVRAGRVADLGRRLFTEFESSRPLDALRQVQLRMRESLLIPSDEIRIERVAGVDVSYQGDRAWAALVVVDAESGTVVKTQCLGSEVRFPYIPSFLAFRELPIVEPLASEVEDGTVLMYDGNGILHPEGFGVASHAGVLFDLPTIGVAKRLLCGKVESRPDSNVRRVELNGETAGYALSANRRSPVFVSPGHSIGHVQTLGVVRRFLRHRIPEPIRMAHALATRERRSAATNK
jgi:deoxyribonuclease V